MTIGRGNKRGVGDARSGNAGVKETSTLWYIRLSEDSRCNMKKTHYGSLGLRLERKRDIFQSGWDLKSNDMRESGGIVCARGGLGDMRSAFIIASVRNVIDNSD